MPRDISPDRDRHRLEPARPEILLPTASYPWRSGPKPVKVRHRFHLLNRRTTPPCQAALLFERTAMRSRIAARVLSRLFERAWLGPVRASAGCG